MSTPNIQASIAAPVQSAKDAGLRYVSDDRIGIRRKRSGKGFRYIGTDDKPLRDLETLSRIRSLVIPPAWNDVWICPNANGHLQATGRDAKGRKQSRYHPRWRATRDETKYEHMMAFSRALPAIRKNVRHDLALPGLPRQKILATIVQLLESTLIRVGNAEYARTNNSFGLTTLRGRHTRVQGARVTFTFQGKSGVRHTVELADRRIAKTVRGCQHIPGYELFQYLDESGNHHAVDSEDVNDYLREISAEDITAKDFRTWAGTVLACMLLRQCEAFTSETQAKKNVVGAIQEVAKRLGNTPSVCRKCYVHPAVLDSYMAGTINSSVKRRLTKPASLTKVLREEESALLRLLRKKSS